MRKISLPWKWITFCNLLIVTLAVACWSQDAQPTVAPLGATPHQGGTTFRVWAPFVDEVAVKINGGTPVPLTKEAGHPQEDDTVWSADVAGVKSGDRYKYLIKTKNGMKEFIDPRSRQLTGSDATASSIIVDTRSTPSSFKQPLFNELVIYELHIGTFNVAPGKSTGTFTDVIAKLDYLKDLGVNAIEFMPVHENAQFPDHKPANYNWGYDTTQLFAVNSSYGSPQDFKKLITECHNRNMAVILDVVYNHLVANNHLVRFGGASGPGFKDGIYFYGDGRVDTGFGPRPDFGRPQVRAYIEDNALMWLREYGVDGLRWDSTINIRSSQSGRNSEGEQLLRKVNDDYRNTDPKEPRKISIAEDLQSSSDLVTPTTKEGFGFNSQWDDNLWAVLRKAICEVNDENRDIGAIKASLEKQIGGDAFGKVIYSENHDKVGHPKDRYEGRLQIRLPALIDEGNAESVFAKRRSTLAAAVVLTAPGIPMLFQGQEMLETRPFDFFTATPTDWKRVERFKGIVNMYRDLIALRRNQAGKTGGLIGPHINVFHADGQKKTLAYHRFGNGGAGDDVVVVVNLSNQSFNSLNVGFPRGGKWAVRFNSGAMVYDAEFKNGDSFDATADQGARDGLNFNGNVGIGPYSVVILSQEKVK